MKHIEPPFKPENGLYGSFQAAFGKYWTLEPTKEGLSGRDWAFLMGLQSDLEHAAKLLPILEKEMTALRNEITSEATRYEL